MLSDEDLLRDTRPAAELQRALLAQSIIRLAYLRRLGRFRRVNEAVEALAVEQDHQSRTAVLDGAGAI